VDPGRELTAVKTFTVEDLIGCYQRGVFPMAEARHDDRIYLVDPPERGVIPLNGFHLSRRLARTIRSGKFQLRIDSDFREVVGRCAEATDGRPETWISRPIQELYHELHLRGLAHSVECWREGALAGGLYGVALGGAFFGESMFSIERDASKVALAHLVARLKYGDFLLLDTQFMTPHLAQFGALEIPKADYLTMLDQALVRSADFYRMPAYAPGEAVLQAISQAS
jgi:leucyl/phenylalanyl-tRNA--protein transferase